MSIVKQTREVQSLGINIALFHSMQLFIAEKIHCVWLADGEVNVLFKCKKFEGPDHLGAATIEAISNKELVQLNTMTCIPHIERLITMVPVSETGLLTKK